MPDEFIGHFFVQMVQRVKKVQRPGSTQQLKFQIQNLNSFNILTIEPTIKMLSQHLYHSKAHPLPVAFPYKEYSRIA